MKQGFDSQNCLETFKLKRARGILTFHVIMLRRQMRVAPGLLAHKLCKGSPERAEYIEDHERIHQPTYPTRTPPSPFLMGPSEVGFFDDRLAHSTDWKRRLFTWIRP
jgi:hypothetical protein